jgi:hypothetical protein
MAVTRTSWRPGQSGNPAGRPPGARNRLSETVVESVLADFEEHGPRVLREVRERHPAVYLRVIASLLPRRLLEAEADDGGPVTIIMQRYAGPVEDDAPEQLPSPRVEN